MTLLNSFSGCSSRTGSDANGALEKAARYLSAWDGTGIAWFAQTRCYQAQDLGEGVQAGADGLAIAWRGRVEEQAGAQGKTRVTRLRRWNRAGGAVAVPFHRPRHDVAAALAMAKLSGPLEPLLLLYACQAWGQWPKAERFLLAVDRRHGAREAWADGMAVLMWGVRRGTVSARRRAVSLGMRKETFLSMRRAAEAQLASWLDSAARAFLHALDGNPEHPADDLNRDRPAPSAPAPRAAPRQGRQPESRRPAGWWDASYARRMAQECPVCVIGHREQRGSMANNLHAMEGMAAEQCHGGQPMKHEAGRRIAAGGI